jgi:subtilisin family serine protease
MNQVYRIIAEKTQHFVMVTAFVFAAFGSASVFAQGEKFGPYLLRAMELTDAALPVVVVMEPVKLSSRSFWDEPTAGDLEYHKKRATLWIGSSDYTGEAMISDYAFLWSTNAMIGKVSQALIWEIAQMESVTKVMYDRKFQPINPEYWTLNSDEVTDFPQAGEYTYGLEKIGVPQIREEHPDLNGSTVYVGILDTGIDASHPELKGKVAAWKDFISSKEQPYDGNGHGTHVAGTIAGEGVNGTEIGIAKNVKLVIGKILSDRGSGSVSGILRGMDWMANPERKLNTTMRPKVVNNSWGGSMEADVRRNPFAQQVVTWVELGIFPAFAAGNSGPGKSTIGTPANLPGAYAVGATDAEDRVTSFSSRGPVKVTDKDGKSTIVVKPDISAPGHQVLSAYPNGKYRRASGTSMACPHLAGAVALLYQVNPELNVEQMVELLKTASEDMGERGRDNNYGEGRLNAYKALNILLSQY